MCWLMRRLLIGVAWLAVWGLAAGLPRSEAASAGNAPAQAGISADDTPSAERPHESHPKVHFTGRLLAIDQASALVVSRDSGADMILIVDHQTKFDPSSLIDSWRRLRPRSVLSITYIVFGPAWVADKIILLSPLAEALRPPTPSGESEATVEEPGGFRAKRTRRLVGSTGPTGAVKGIVTAVDQTCQALQVHTTSGGDLADLVVAVDNETQLHHGSARAHWPELIRGAEVTVLYFTDGPVRIAKDIAIVGPGKVPR